jgi:hypothetical protein
MCEPINQKWVNTNQSKILDLLKNEICTEYYNGKNKIIIPTQKTKMATTTRPNSGHRNMAIESLFNSKGYTKEQKEQLLTLMQKFDAINNNADKTNVNSI